MRILHFCNYADRVGGAEVYAQSLVSAQSARGHEVALFGASPRGELDRPGLRVIQRPPYDAARLVRDPAALTALREFMQRFQPEVVHVHNVFSVALEVIDYLVRAGVPLLHTVHDFQLLCPNSWCVRGDGAPCPGGAGAQCFQHDCRKNYPYDSWDVLLSAVRQQLTCAGVDIALAPSTYLVERLRAHGWRDVRNLPYFIDFEPAPQATPRADSQLLYVGRLEREKGIDVLLAAMPEVARAIPGACLDIVGSGSEERSLNQLAERFGLGAAVRFHTSVPRDRLGEFYSGASLCILPSVWTENSPLVAYECLLSGLPMVGSRIGGIPELIEPDCGTTFTPRDPRDLAANVIRFLRLPRAVRDQMSVAARARSRAFDKIRHLEFLDRVYSELQIAGRKDHQDQPLAELLPILARVGDDRILERGPPTLLERTRRVAKVLGLPKFFPRR